MKSILLVIKLLELVEMIYGLVNAIFSLPEWPAVKMIFFAPWYVIMIVYSRQKNNLFFLFFKEQKEKYLPLVSTIYQVFVSCLKK